VWQVQPAPSGRPAALRQPVGEAVLGVAAWPPVVAHAGGPRKAAWPPVVARAGEPRQAAVAAAVQAVAALAAEPVLRVEEAPRQAAPDALAELLLVLPSAAVWVSHPDLPPPWPARPSGARRVRGRTQTAGP